MNDLVIFLDTRSDKKDQKTMISIVKSKKFLLIFIILSVVCIAGAVFYIASQILRAHRDLVYCKLVRPDMSRIKVHDLLENIGTVQFVDQTCATGMNTLTEAVIFEDPIVSHSIGDGIFLVYDDSGQRLIDIVYQPGLLEVVFMGTDQVLLPCFSSFTQYKGLTPGSEANIHCRPTPIPTPTVTPSVSTADRTGIAMVYIPEGEFVMGSENGKRDEQPQHTVYLDAFWIDRTEVTTAMYEKCVADGKCPLAGYINDLGYAGYSDQAVVYIDWEEANDYCKWAGKKLPTEAQWEKAARGYDGRKFPWGDQAISCALANYYECGGDTDIPGKRLRGASPYGALDMAGNVREWVADWYDEYYYEKSPSRNPSGPSSGEYHVVRGGGWGSIIRETHTYFRDTYPTILGYADLGFRCVLP